MNDEQLINIFIADKPTYEAVYNAVKAGIEAKRDLFIRNIRDRKSQSNEEIGANIRAFDEAVLLVDAGFRELGRPLDVSGPDGKNPGR